MNVLQIHNNADPSTSGAAMAVSRIHGALKLTGIESKILCVKNADASPDAVSLPELHSRLPRALEYRLRHYAERNGLRSLASLRSFKISSMPEYDQADILHIHTIHNSAYSYLSLPWLTRGKPAVCTLHDMWSITGHCIHSFDCERWKTGCGDCPYPNTYPAIEKDNTRLEWKLKKWAFSSSNVAIAAPSKWLARLGEQSLLKGKRIVCVPHGVDTDLYRPRDPDECRRLLGIPTDKRVLMMGAVNLTDPLKGGDLLIQSLQNLPASLKKEICLVVLGRDGSALTQAVDVECRNLGFLKDDATKAAAYSAADVFVLPTRAESFGLMLIESMACGTPLISFDVGGVPDLVRPHITGYLARAEDAADLGIGITTIVEDEALRDRLSVQCREIALAEYTIERCAERYVALYRQLLEGSTNGGDARQNNSDSSHLQMR